MTRTLSLNELQGLLAKEAGVGPQTRAEVEAKILECIIVLEDKLKKPIRAPEIVYDLRGRTSGRANSKRIRLNGELLTSPDYREDMLHSTVPHEVAHVAQRQIWPKSKSHGDEWFYIMYQLGFPRPSVYHAYKTTPARNHKKFLIHCYGCGRDIKVTALLRDRMAVHGRKYTCSNCKSPLSYEVWRNQ